CQRRCPHRAEAVARQVERGEIRQVGGGYQRLYSGRAEAVPPQVEDLEICQVGGGGQRDCPLRAAVVRRQVETLQPGQRGEAAEARLQVLAGDAEEGHLLQRRRPEGLGGGQEGAGGGGDPGDEATLPARPVSPQRADPLLLVLRQ